MAMQQQTVSLAAGILEILKDWEKNRSAATRYVKFSGEELAVEATVYDAGHLADIHIARGSEPWEVCLHRSAGVISGQIDDIPSSQSSIYAS